jgi:hypothetical protein
MQPKHLVDKLNAKGVLAIASMTVFSCFCHAIECLFRVSPGCMPHEVYTYTHPDCQLLLRCRDWSGVCHDPGSIGNAYLSSHQGF